MAVTTVSFPSSPIVNQVYTVGSTSWRWNGSNWLSITPNAQLSVKDFGATGDGTTDDTAAIQAAVDAAVGGNTVFFPAGTYLISSAIELHDKIALVGDAQYKSIIKTTNMALKAMVDITSVFSFLAPTTGYVFPDLSAGDNNSMSYVGQAIRIQALGTTPTKVFNLIALRRGTQSWATAYSNPSWQVTTLATTINDGTDKVITLTDASQFAFSGTIVIDDEEITYTAKNGNSLIGITRGANGTAAVLHTAGVQVSEKVKVGDTFRAAYAYKSSLPSPASQYQAYVDTTDSNKLKYYNGSTWVTVGSVGATTLGTATLRRCESVNYEQQIKNLRFESQSTITTSAIVANTQTGVDSISCSSTSGLVPNQLIWVVYSYYKGGTLELIVANKPYYVKEVLTTTSFTISDSSIPNVGSGANDAPVKSLGGVSATYVTQVIIGKGTTWVARTRFHLKRGRFENISLGCKYGLNFSNYPEECVIDGIYAADTTGQYETLLNIRGNANIIHNVKKDDTGNLMNTAGLTTEPYIIVDGDADTVGGANLLTNILIQGASIDNKPALKISSAGNEIVNFYTELYYSHVKSPPLGVAIIIDSAPVSGDVKFSGNLTGLSSRKKMVVTNSSLVKIESLDLYALSSYDYTDSGAIDSCIVVDANSYVTIDTVYANRSQNVMPAYTGNIKVNKVINAKKTADSLSIPATYQRLSDSSFTTGNLLKNPGFRAGTYGWKFGWGANTYTAPGSMFKSISNTNNVLTFIWDNYSDFNRLYQEITVTDDMIGKPFTFSSLVNLTPRKIDPFIGSIDRTTNPKLLTLYSTTTSAQVNSGSTSIPVNGSLIKNSDSIIIVGAGAGGSNLATTVSSGGGTNTLTIATATSTTINSGTAVSLTAPASLYNGDRIVIPGAGVNGTDLVTAFNPGQGSTTLTLSGILSSVTITSINGEFSCNSLLTNYDSGYMNRVMTVGMAVTISGTNTGTGSRTDANGNVLSWSGTYYIMATNGSTTFQLTDTPGGTTSIYTTKGTPSGLVFDCPDSASATSVSNVNVMFAPWSSRISPWFRGCGVLGGLDPAIPSANRAPLITYNYATNIDYFLSGVTITGTGGQFSCTTTTGPLAVGMVVKITGTNSGNGSITGYANRGGQYYIIATNGYSTFTLSSTLGGSAIATTVGADGTTTGLTFNVSGVTGWQLMSQTVTPTSTGTLEVGFMVNGNLRQFKVAECNFNQGDMGVQNQSSVGSIDITDKTIAYDTAVPTTGTWTVGSRVFNSAPTAGSIKSWVCTTAGSPGTWVAEGGDTYTGEGTVTIGTSNVASNIVLAPGTTSGTVDVSGKKITSLGNPSVNTDAANKAYVDSVATGLDVKASVRVATIANITNVGATGTATTLPTIDGVALAANDRVLVKNQTLAADNGIYVAKNNVVWSRATDADANSEVTSGMFTFVEQGATNGGTGWVLTTPGTINLDTTSLTFSKFSDTTYTLPAATTGALGGVIVPAVATSGITNSSGTIGLATASTTQLGGVIIPAVATSGITNSSGTIGLATASDTQLGGVKVGTGLAINNGVLSSTITQYSLPTASTSVLGGVKVDGSTITIANGVISSTGGGGSSYTLPIATDTVLGGIKLGYGLIGTGFYSDIVSVLNPVVVTGIDASSIGIGPDAILNLDMNTAQNNIAIGFEALTTLVETSRNIAIGYQAATLDAVSNDSISVGNRALAATLSSIPMASLNPTYGATVDRVIDNSDSISIGSSANLYGLGLGNIAIGSYALASDSNAYYSNSNYNIAIGHNAMEGTPTGDDNIAIGRDAFSYGDQYSANNIMIGAEAGWLMGGSSAKPYSGGNNNIFIGHQAGSGISDAGATVIIGAAGSESSPLPTGITADQSVILANGIGSIKIAFNSYGAMGFVNNSAMDYGTAGYVLKSAGSGGKPYWGIAGGSIATLSDVVLSGTPTNNQVLKYNSSSNKWVNGSGSADLSSVTGTLAVANGGTGTTTGSITGSSGNLTFAAAAGNNNVIITPSGTGTVDVSSKRISNLALPTADGDAASKTYVDAVTGGVKVQTPVAAATAGNINTTTVATYNAGAGTFTLDKTATAGTALTVDNLNTTLNVLNTRILVKDQGTPSQNGIYKCTTVATTGVNQVWTRDTDVLTTAGNYYFVQAGQKNVNSAWVLINPTQLTFVQYSAPVTTLAGVGLTRLSNTLSLTTTGSTTGQVLTSNGVGVEPSWVTPTLYSRTTVSGTTSSLNAAETGNVDITGYKSYMLYKAVISKPSWVRIYVDAASRLADASRNQNTDPTLASGVVAEFITTQDAQTVIVAPAVFGWNNENSPTATIPIAVTNNGTSQQTISVTLTVIKTEN